MRKDGAESDAGRINRLAVGSRYIEFIDASVTELNSRFAEAQSAEPLTRAATMVQ